MDRSEGEISHDPALSTSVARSASSVAIISISFSCIARIGQKVSDRMARKGVFFVAPTALTLRRGANPTSSTRRRPPQAALKPLSLSEAQQNALVLISVPSLPLLAYSEYALLTTGCGLPPGPFGLLGAAEGVSYLLLVALVALSLYAKASTGRGLPDGPAKLLGASEGVAFLLALAGLAVAAFTVWKFGALPSAAPGPGSRCFPIE